MAIAEEDVAAVRAATDLVALAGEHVALKRQGRRWVGRCPFHSERTPSFSVNAEEGLYYCFGCQASGDAITFVRAMEHLDFVGAVERLAGRAGVPLRTEGPEADRHSRRSRLLETMEAAVAWYHQRLLSHADAGPARDYLRSRGYDATTVRRFRLGWAPDEWDALTRALAIPDDLLRETGLGFVNRAGRRQDAFRARIVFPIFDPGGRAVALGGRILPTGSPPAASGDGPPRSVGAIGPSPEPFPRPAPRAEPGPKYKNSPETAVYAKRRILYGLNWAKSDVVATGEVVVCEGYTDVIALFQAGVPRAVATCGTALAEEHFKLLRNFARRVVLAYDADSAGQAAAERFYEWERRHELDIAVAELPGGTDPAELGRRDPGALREAVAAARPFLEFRLGRALRGADLSGPEGRARAAEAALAVVAEHPSALVRDQYVMEVASRCRAGPDQLRALLAVLVRRPGAGSPRSGEGPRPGTGPRPGGEAQPGGEARRGGEAQPGGEARRGGEAQPAGQPWPGGRSRPSPGGYGERSSPGPSHGGDGPGLEGLRLRVHRPEEVAHRLEEVLFDDPVQRSAFRALASSDTLHQAIAGAGPDAAALLSRLAVEETQADADDVVRLLVKAAAERALAVLDAEARASEPNFAQLAAQVAWLRLGIESLADARATTDVTGALLAWLVEWAEEEP